MKSTTKRECIGIVFIEKYVAIVQNRHTFVKNQVLLVVIFDMQIRGSRRHLTTRQTTDSNSAPSN